MKNKFESMQLNKQRKMFYDVFALIVGHILIFFKHFIKNMIFYQIDFEVH